VLFARGRRIARAVRERNSALRRPQSPRERVIALADERALVGRADEVAVLHHRQRLRRPEAMGRPAAAAAVAFLFAAVGGDRVGRHVGDDGRAAELVAQGVAEARVDRAVPARARGARRAAGDEVADGVEVRRKPGGSDGLRSGGAWGRAERMVV